MSRMDSTSPTSSSVWALPLLVATVAMVWVVPEWPLLNLDDPSHWGVLGYVVSAILVVRLRLLGAHGTRAELRLLAIFLAAMPVIYIANWLRFGGETEWLLVELAGALPFWLLAWLGLRGKPWLVVLGIAGHALWDGWHYDRVDFVPSWYALACAAVDAGVAIYAAGQVGSWLRRLRRD